MAIGIFVLLLLTLIPLYTEAGDCTGLPTDTVLRARLQPLVDSEGGEGGALLDKVGVPFYTCQVQGTTMGTYQMLSLIVTYNLNNDAAVRVRQLEMNCLEFNDMFSWEAVSGSLAAVDTNVVDYVNIAVRTDCSSCTSTASNDHHCQACNSACNDGLMRCTGTGSNDCCAAFEDSNCILTTTCSETNFVAIEQNNFTCACGLNCTDGYTLNPTECSCVLTDICVADNPCTNGVCNLISSPDQYTCDCTGTNHMGMNCSECDLPDSACDEGYIVNSTTCSCVLDNICQADNPCTNGMCNLISSPDQYTCNCTGTNYMGTLCSVCSLDCDNGYEADTSCIDCVLSHICTVANPCHNGATCVEGSAPHLYTCQCVDYYNGVNCTACGLECLNNGTIDENCQTCVCDTGYTGLNCSSCDDGYTVENGICTMTDQKTPSFQWWWVVVPVVVILVVPVAIILIISFIIFKVVRSKSDKSGDETEMKQPLK